MAKIKKFTNLNIRKIKGGKDPILLIEDFVSRMGFEPKETAKERSKDSARWMLKLSSDEELEILVEALKLPSETSVYMGVNIATVPLRGASDMLIAALEIADGLVGIKISLVGHFLVLSASMGLASISLDDLEYHYRLIDAQQSWFKEALAEELGWELEVEGGE